MKIAEQTRFDVAQRKVKNHDTMLLPGYSIFAIALLIAIYFDSMSAETAPGNFATMTVFP